MNSHKISVVIPTIGRDSLRQSLESCLYQNYPDFEILVIDDSILQNIVIVNPRVKVFYTGGSKGVSEARNLGIQNATGGYIAFLDDDDVWFRDKLGRQLRFMILEGLDASYTKARMVPRGKIRPKIVLPNGKSPIAYLYDFSQKWTNNSYLGLSTLIVKKLIISSEFNIKENNREDLIFINDIFKNGGRIAQLNEVLCDIYISPERSVGRSSLRQDFIWCKYIWSHSIFAAMNFLFFVSLRNSLWKSLHHLKMFISKSSH